jgi:hypothetical protein
VLLLDPTVKSGVPLWGGSRNLSPTPDPKSNAQTPNSESDANNFYKDFLFWAQKPEIFSAISPGSNSHIHVPMQALLHLICSEWRTMSDYIKTRLCQIDLEIVKPKQFASDKRIDSALDKLNMWGRFIPLYREMVTETLQQVFRFPCHTEAFASANETTTEEQLATVNGMIYGKAMLYGRELKIQLNPFTLPYTIVPQPRRHSTGTMTRPATPQVDTPRPQVSTPERPRLGSIAAYKNDFMLTESYLEEYQKRIDRLT